MGRGRVAGAEREAVAECPNCEHRFRAGRRRWPRCPGCGHSLLETWLP